MRKFTLLFFSLFIISHVFSQVIINEFQPSNESIIADPDFNEYTDWIELYNAGSADVDLSGYYLTDRLKDTTMWQFPQGTNIAAGGYLLVWADNKNYNLHTNFKLDRISDQIALYSASKILLDKIQYSEIEKNYSIGRQEVNGTVWRLFTTPTPGEANTAGAKMKAPEAVFSHKGGYYPGTISVTLESLVSNSSMFYTKDGSMPTNSSTKYTSPISISQNTVLKVLVVSNSYNNSRVSVQTYFINERYSDLPVVSIGVDPFDFLDETYGIYSMGPNASSWDPNYGANFWEDIELPATFEYFVDQKKEIDVNTGIQIHGGWSRRFDQRSFSINCRQAYGDERMRYQFFKNKDIDVFKQIIIKNGGVDVASLKYRDMMINDLVHDRMDIDYQAGQPCIVYINGEYWGILNIREKIQERYLKDNYGLEDYEIDLLANYEEVIEGSDEAFIDFFSYWGYYNGYDDYGTDPDMTNSTTYNNVAKEMDINEYINYMITEIYVSNHDWPGCNIKYWKSYNSGSKWRWILYDTDQSFAYYDRADETTNRLEFATGTGSWMDWGNSNSNSTIMLRTLLENTSFKNAFIQRFAAHMNSTFSPSRVKALIDSYETTLQNEIPYHLARWGETKDTCWKREYNDMIRFANDRGGYMKSHIKSYFGLSGTADLTIKTNNGIAGKFKICDVDFEGASFTGEYFKNIPFNIVALPALGMKFLRWENNAGEVISTDKMLNQNISSNTTLVAVYEEQNYYANLYINEFMADNLTTYSDSRNDYDDWIEIYNDNDYPVDIAGLWLTDSLATPLLYQIPESDNGETVIPAKGVILLWADSDEAQGPLHLSFKLDKNGEQIGLSSFNGTTVSWIDSLTYGPQTTDVSMGLDVDGSDNMITMSNPTPGRRNDGTSAVEPIADVEVSVYPTLVEDYINVDFGEYTSATINIFSVVGNKVKTFDANMESLKQLYLGDLEKGLYVISISNDTNAYDFKFVKE